MYIQGSRIRQRRKQLNMTQEDLAAAVQAQQKQISMWERGESEPSTEMVYNLAKSLNVSADWLFGISDEMVSIGESSLTSAEKAALELLRSQPPDQQERIVNAIKALTY
jgi:HTH-type transcriptional regulator, cell division transcriptional repressor